MGLGTNFTEGKVADFRTAVQAKDDETVYFPGSSGPTKRQATRP
nr:DUF1428 family protein [Hoeflea halophila]